jgi:hypothetical protein
MGPLALLILVAASVPAAAQHAAPAPGSFVGAVLVSDDAEAASSFYSELFGWDMERADDGGFAVRHKGRMVAGITPLRDTNPDIEESFWLVGLAVDDVQAALAAAERAGGTIYERAERVSDYGHFAVIADRQTAPLLLVEAGTKPIGGTTGPGSWVWAELWTDDVNDAATFYQTVLGVASDVLDRSGSNYGVLTSEETARAGMVTIPDEFESLDPGWAPYVGVGDLTASLEQVEKLGGAVIFNVTEHPAQGAVALIRDPSGAVLFLYQLGSHSEAAQ